MRLRTRRQRAHADWLREQGVLDPYNATDEEVQRAIRACPTHFTGFTLVDHKKVAGTVTPAANMTGANLLLVGCATFGGAVPTMTDSTASNTWNNSVSVVSGVNVRCTLFWLESPTVSAAQTFTIGNASFPAFCVSGWSGLGPPTGKDQSSSAGTASGTSLQAGSVTPGVVNELIFFALGLAAVNTPSYDSGLAALDNQPFGVGVNMGSSVGYLIDSANSAINPKASWSTTTDGAAVIATFKPAAGGVTVIEEEGLIYQSRILW
jgi:hypothetical protein